MFSRIFHLALALAAAAPYPSKAESLLPLGGDVPEVLSPLSVQGIRGNVNLELHQQYTIGDPAVKQKTLVEIYKYTSTGSALVKRDTPTPSPPPPNPRAWMPIDLTPAKCTSQVCYSGSYGGPEKTDCDVIVAAQMYNSTGSLVAPAGHYVLVSYGSCTVIFQHPMGKPKYNQVLQYNWAKLGSIILDLQKKCLKPDDQSIGGACKIARYGQYKFHNVVISLQRYIAPATPPTPNQGV
ncbi:hypothetical protein MJO29_011639 [Puccinia striiformis f. sp. tritici]|uniref:Ecp2 effector protein domain-containing protein n=1 Tax=Puccinia striiformis f. sp. tritici PST-78 TaxID=1165861 RepID=A0A0L0W028_9BASI|nr:hypothetical protein MJO29_011639 [Puccinia striiformis f. sp. tritici]KNF04822.1 hypothetical protein PSTG_01879 [Puccinia striiformis f. sp. tritici PST-78]